ncbi:Protocadherin-7 [Clonorchis sinensis]|uniref:Protocadherin-7 n=1 Tax=Clonorchis sinensis TaxID=79923 RepID=A0A8T1M6H5_CLOSI|nr:Protocadherin-7 [Clonorchis sinensis]
MTSLWSFGINTMLRVFLLAIPQPSWSYSLFPERGVTQALRLTTQVSESAPDTIVANLTKLLSNSGIPNDFLHQQNRSLLPVTFELLDISANLLSMLFPHQRVNFASVVHIESHFGLLKFTVSLDRERLCTDLQGTNTPCAVNLLLVAHIVRPPEKAFAAGSGDQPDSQKTHKEAIYIDLTIIVVDVNDNSPYFPKLAGSDLGIRNLYVTEECPLGTLISLPMALDSDSLDNGIRRYDFHSTSTSVEIRQHFQIRLFRGVGIQCEHMQLDPENRILDTDLDGLDAPSNPGVIPCLQVIRRIDREQVNQFNFRLVAFDAANHQGDVNVRLIVRDINDNYPTWSRVLTVYTHDGRTRLVEGVQPSGWMQSSSNRTTDNIRYWMTTRECTSQRKLVQLKADDQDDPETDNGRVNFQISEQSPDLERIRRRIFISGDHIYLTDSGLRGLSLMNISLLVTAKDGAGKSSDAWMDLHIEDCNDHPPMILMRGTEFSLIENSRGQADLISLITVRDLDVESSANSVFRCFLNDTRYFSLKEAVHGPAANVLVGGADQKLFADVESPQEFISNPPSSSSFDPGRRGRWSVFRLETLPTVHFDRESTARYIVMLQCVDNGTPALTSNRVIVINIQDVNDNHPRFYRKEDRQTLVEQNQLGWNTKRSDSLQSAWNLSEQKNFEFHVAENADRGSLVGRLYAADPDSGENARITFEMVSSTTLAEANQGNSKLEPDQNERFTVSTGGEIHLIKELDREQQDKYLLHVRARDNGSPESLSSTATVVIHVEDVNDCHPEFHGEYNFNVVESYGSSTIHQVLGSLNATDDDLGRNGSITYRIAKESNHKRGTHTTASVHQTHVPPSSHERPGAQLVQITHDGQLTVYGVVDREKTPVILVDVIAEDNGFPVRLSSTITVTIHVLDLNDNKPKFVFAPTTNADRSGNETTSKSYGPGLSVPYAEPAYTLNLSLDTSVGTMLMKFNAIDPDDGPNGTVSYEIIYSGVTPPRKMQTSKAETYNMADKDSSEIQTFTLHPDGRLILSKQLTSDEIPSSSHSKLVHSRYRRPDRLLIRASDDGPSPEHAITGLHIFYFDSVAQTSLKTQAVNIPTFNQPQPIRTAGPRKANIGSPPESGTASGHFRSKNRFEETYAKGSTDTKSAELSTPRIGSLPVLYLLALAVCFALLLVVASLAYLYVKMKRPSSSRSTTQKYLDPSVRATEAHNSLTGSHHNPFGEIQLEVSTCAHSTSDPNETSSTVRYQTGKSSPISATVNSSCNYRTLGPAYLMLEREDPNALLTLDKRCTDKFSRPVWTTLGPDYTELNEPSINMVYGADGAKLSPEFVNTQRHNFAHPDFPSLIMNHAAARLHLHPHGQPVKNGKCFRTEVKPVTPERRMFTLGTLHLNQSHSVTQNELADSPLTDNASNQDENVRSGKISALEPRNNEMNCINSKGSIKRSTNKVHQFASKPNTTQNNSLIERHLSDAGQSRVTASFV